MALARGNIINKNLFKIFSPKGQISASRYVYSRVINNPTAGIIIIGDEILKAQVKDTNSNHICSLLYKCGVKVKKISVVSDEVDIIAEEILNFAKKYTYVITAGGIGPTHDDVTFEALAKAFNDSLHYHPKLIEVVRTFSGSQDISTPGYKLAYIPESAALEFGKKKSEAPYYPCINLKNVYVFPGSPIFMQKSFGNVYEELFASNQRFVKKELYLAAREELFADALAVVAKEFPNVTLGSYPTMNHSYYSALVTIESNDEEQTNRAIARFLEFVPSNFIVNYDTDPLNDALRKYKEFVSVDKQGPLYEATLTWLKKIYSQPSRVAICLDGSIETTVLIHLAHVCNLSRAEERLQTVHLKEEKPSRDVDIFIKETVDRYHLELHTLQGSAKKAIEEFRNTRPEIQTLILGLKGNDTTGGIWHSLVGAETVPPIHFQLPLVNWTYRNIWNFARSLNLPYCKLYDKGYTSLGNSGQTEPNPSLMRRKHLGQTEYLPAYMLDDVDVKRAGKNPETNKI